MKNTKVRNQLELWLFCAIIGAFAGGLVWALLKVLAVGTEQIRKTNACLYWRNIRKFKSYIKSCER